MTNTLSIIELFFYSDDFGKSTSKLMLDRWNKSDMFISPEIYNVSMAT